MNPYYLCNKVTKQVLSIGPLPDTYKDASGISSVPYSESSDLSWAGYPEMGFLTEEDAILLGIDVSIINAQKLRNIDQQWAQIRMDRDTRIEQVRWRVERHSGEIILGLTPSENIMPILSYVQKLRDLTKQEDPFNIIWPILEY